MNKNIDSTHDFNGVHLRHCYQGEYEDNCKYGEDKTCPARPKCFDCKDNIEDGICFCNRENELNSITPKQQSNFYEGLKEYFQNTPREKVLEDWNESAHLDNVGPTVEEYLQQGLEKHAHELESTVPATYTEQEVLEILFSLHCNSKNDEEEVIEWFSQFKKQ